MDNQSAYQQQSPPPEPQQNQSQTGTFERRIGRAGFLLGIIYWLTFLIVPIIIQIIVHSILNSNGASSPIVLLKLANIISVLFGLAAIVLLIPTAISLYVRRLHDINQSGMLAFLLLVPFVSTLLFLYLLFAPGNREANKYGYPIGKYNYWVVMGLKKPS